METNPQLPESLLKDLLKELREVKEAVKRIERKLDALDYRVSQIKCS